MNKIVGKIRKITQEIIDSSLSARNYEQPDENFQEENIKELMDNGIEIVVVNAPLIITDSPIPTPMVVRRLDIDEKIVAPPGCKKIFIYNWFKMQEIGQNHIQIIRLAFTSEEVNPKEHFLI